MVVGSRRDGEPAYESKGGVVGEAVLDELVDGDHRDPVVGRELLKVREPRGRPVLAQHLADHRHRREPGEAGEVDRRFGVATALEHATFTGAEGEDVAGAL